MCCLQDRKHNKTYNYLASFLDENNYVFWSKQPKMQINTYFPASAQPHIIPESYLASSRIHAVMIYSGWEFLTSGQTECSGSHTVVGQIHIRKLKPDLWGDIVPGSDVPTRLVFSQSAGLGMATLFTQTTLHRGTANTDISCLVWYLSAS